MRKVRDSCGKSVSRGDPAGLSRGPTARGKRVPEAEINIQIVQAKKTAGHADRSPQLVGGKQIFHQINPQLPGMGSN
ncbi:hypothetical protein P4576_15935 [Peribacillus frigoritolerans]|uniref:hypothetical protein n=1 Tax=Peribacillus frigoritolerans TaxID=450367 RepID=UPI002E1B9F70|nr:hypothetical protein [Peribacillus frigoritolerans]